jgi:oxygen-dependent protoporphyrinogen oxidase
VADRVVVIGGGISGLTLAHELERRGVEHLLLEAADRVGGVIRSGTVGGHLLEYGPQRARLSADFDRLVEELALRDRLIEAPPDLPLYVYRSGRLRRVPLSAAQFLLTDLLPLSAKLRVLAEPLTRAAADDESVGGFLRRKLGRAAYEDLAGPLYGGLYASDPDDMIVALSLRHTLRELGVGRSLLLRALRGGRTGAPVACSFIDGLEELPRSLHGRHRSRIRLRSAARGLSRAGARWVVRTDAEAIDASHVVIATPGRAAAELLREALPDAAYAIRRLVYNPLALVHLHAETSLHGLGYQVSLAESMVTRGVTFNQSLFGRAGVYTSYLGGARNRWVSDAPDEKLAKIAVDEFRQATRVDARVIAVSRQWMPAWDRSWQAIQALDLPAGLHVHASWHSRPGLPGRLAGSRKLADTLAAGR